MNSLFPIPLAGIEKIDLADANRCLIEWGHKLGPVERPFRSECYLFRVDGVPTGVAVSASIVSSTVAGYRRMEVVELARCAAREPWVNRVLLRLWREVCAPRWACWPVRAAVSYHHNGLHTGDLYRFDGWRKVKDDCGSSGGGTYSTKREAGDALAGKKTLWVWEYPDVHLRTLPAAG